MGARVRRLMRLTLCLALTLCFCCLTALAVGAEEGGTGTDTDVTTPATYEIYLGGVQVTDENCSDILGDTASDENATPRAVYDPEEQVLSLCDLSVTGCYTNGSGSYSLAVAEAGVTVKLTGSVTFPWGIYVAEGSVEIEDAIVTFEGRAGGTGFVQIQSGDLTVEESTIVGQGLDGVTDVCFGADIVTVEGSMLLMTPLRGKLPTFGSVLQADERMLIDGCYITFQTDHHSAESFLTAYGNTTVRDSVIQASGVNTFVNMQDGSFVASTGTRLIATHALYGFVLNGNAEFNMAEVNVGAHYAGIVLNPEGEVNLKIRSSDIQLYNPGFNAFTKGPLANQWEANQAQLKQTYETFDDYVSYYWAVYSENTGSIRNAALYANNASVSMTHTDFSAKDYAVGILYRSCGKHFSVGDGSSLTIKSTKAAFFGMVEEEGEVRFGSGMAGDVQLFSIPCADILGTLGNYAVTFSTGGASFERIEGATPVLDTEELLGKFRGCAWSCHVTVKEFPVAAVAIPCVALALVSVAVVLLYQFRDRIGFLQRKKNKKKDEA